MTEITSKYTKIHTAEIAPLEILAAASTVYDKHVTATNETDEKTKALSAKTFETSKQLAIQPCPLELNLEKVETVEPATTDVELDNTAEEAPPVNAEKPIESPTITKPKGRIVSLLGSERVAYWCPKIGLVAGGILGFYTTNLVQNFGIFFAVSQTSYAHVMAESLQKLNPYLGTCTSCNMPMPTAAAPAFADIDAKLAASAAFNAKTFEVLNDVGATIAQTTATHAEASVFSVAGAKTAISFAKEATSGDVPLNFLSLANGCGATVGGFGGYALGVRLANWLNS